MDIYEQMASGVKQEKKETPKEKQLSVATERIRNRPTMYPKTAQSIFSDVCRVYAEKLDTIILTPKQRRQMDRIVGMEKDSGDDKVDYKRKDNNNYFLDRLMTFLEFAINHKII